MTTIDDTARLAHLRRALFEQRVRGTGAPAVAQPRPVTSRTASGPLPLPPSQAQLWYLSQLAPDSRAYNELIEIRKIGALDVDALRRALTTVVSRHETWRTTFDCVDGVPHQFVHEPTEIDLPLVDLSYLDTGEAECRAVQIAAAEAVRPYDLARGPFIRPLLVRITDEYHRLCLAMHHLVFDGVTMQRLLLPELIAAYRAYTTGEALSLPEPEVQYRDFILWQQDWLSGPIAAARIARCRDRLAGVRPAQLPVDYPQPAGQRSAGGAIPVTIEAATVDALTRAARRVGATFFHALAGAHAWWLHRYTESTDVLFSSPHDLRYRKDLLTVAGYCATPVVVRCQVTGRETFTELVERMRGEVADAVSDVVPLQTLLAELGVPRDPRYNPLFQTALNLEPPMTSPADDWSLHLMQSDIANAIGATKFDVNIELDHRQEGHVVGRLFFSTDLFERQTAQEMASSWCRLLDVAAAAPDLPMAEHDLLTADERRRQLDWNPALPHAISSRCVHDVIGSQVERTPDAVAVQVGDAALTYRQLHDRAAAIASRLVAAGAGPGTVVAVLMGRRPDLVAALLGILKSGAAYLPLDPRQPAARNNYCINDSGASIVLVDRDLPTEMRPAQARVVNLGESGKAAPCHVDVSPDELAYVLYTSGSTGRPKGVLVEHRNVVNLMHTMFREFGITASDTVLSVAAVTFDMSVGDIFCALGCGARLVLATVEQAMNPAALRSLIGDVGATYMMATPTTWSALIAAGWGGDRNLTAASIGEALTDTLADALLHRCRAVWNAFGPTEATDVTTVARLAEGDTVTVGRPLPGVRVYVTDPGGRLQPVGLPGEIAIGGAGVARGYLNRPDEHARRFGDDPFHVGGRIYRTGDRGRFLPDGRLQYLGRYDDQIKIRGFRIEPGEIESILSEHPKVGACAVIAREAPNGEQQLVAYIVGESGSLSDDNARDWLRRRLPEHMVPSAFVHLSALPMTPNGKLDKAALPAPSWLGTRRTGSRPPRSDTERRLAKLWAGLLRLPVTDVNRDFFDVGGHSLLAARLICEVEQEFGVPVALAAFLDNGRTVAGLAKLLDAERAHKPREVTSTPPLHFVFPDLASAMAVRHFAAQWGSAQPVHALILEQPGGRFDRSVTIQQHAGRALSAIQDRQPDGPLALVGYSIGSYVAYEIARQAVDAGREVSWLGILDTLAPSMKDLLQAHLAYFTLGGRLGLLRQKPGRERWAKYADVALRVLRNGPGVLRRLPPVNDFDYRGALEIAYRNQQQGHDVPMHLFVGEDSAAEAKADLLGWDGFHNGRLTVKRLAGDHHTLLQPPDVEQLAQLMLESLCNARLSTDNG